jgi:hypothetical protein
VFLCAQLALILSTAFFNALFIKGVTVVGRRRPAADW